MHNRQAENARGTTGDRGYSTPGHRKFRKAVLRRDPFCKCEGEDCHPEDPETGACLRVSTVADHWPKSRKQLLAERLDPNDPICGRGLCASCHSRETARNRDQRGGFVTPWKDR